MTEPVRKAPKEEGRQKIAGEEISIRLMGKFEVQIDGSLIPPEAWKLRKVRGLIKLLALAPSHRMRRDEVIELLWPEADPESGVNALNQVLFNTRQVLNRGKNPFQKTGKGKMPGYLELKDGLLSLAPGCNVQVDVERFEEDAAAIAQAATRQPVKDPTIYQAALSWYRGDLLPEDEYEDWAAGRREALRQHCLQLLSELAKLHEIRDEPQQAIQTYLRILSMEPADEAAHAGLMRLYTRKGQRGLALRQYQTLREALRELDSEPDPTIVRLYEEILTRKPGGLAVVGITQAETSQAGWLTFPPSSPVKRKLDNLPYRISTFIGREKEIDQVLDMLRTTRLLTITGTGGVGKTSLAAQAAMYLSAGIYEGAAYPDGIWLVELASLDDPLLIPQACAQALDVTAIAGESVMERIEVYLEDKHLLLILDNCEHLADACARFADTLLKKCRSLTVLATSRGPLGLAGETTYRLPSLAVPEADRKIVLDELAQIESVRLLVERAGKAAPGFILAQSNAAAIVQITRQLEGIPLAIELAAARMRMLNPDEVAARLNDAILLLTGGSPAALPRQQTLKATIDWSYALLTNQERILLRRLSIFAGGFSLEGAEAVCADGSDRPADGPDWIAGNHVLDLLGNLLNQSLIHMEAGEVGTRYRLLETIRQYARERLAGEDNGLGEIATRNQHLACYARLTREAELHLRSKGQLVWLSRLDAELDNVRIALEWSRAGQVELGLQIAADLMWYWHIRGLFDEGVEWLEKLLANEVQLRNDGSLTGERAIQRGRALRAHLLLARYIRQYTNAEQIAELQESIRLLRLGGASARRDLAISILCLLEKQRRLDQPSPDREEMLAIFQEIQDGFYLSDYLFKLSGLILYRGDNTQGQKLREESLSLSREIEDYLGGANTASALGYTMLCQGHYETAETLYQESIACSQKIKNPWLGLTSKGMLIWTYLAQGKYAEVDRLGEEVRGTYREMKYSFDRLVYPFSSVHLVCNLIQSAWSEGDDTKMMRFVREIYEQYQGHEAGQAIALLYHGRSAIALGELAQAEALIHKSLAGVTAMRYGSEEIRFGWQVELLLGALSLFARQKKWAAAARILGSLHHYPRFAPTLSPRERDEYNQDQAAARAALGEEGFEMAFEAGQAVTIDQTVDFAAAVI